MQDFSNCRYNRPYIWGDGPYIKIHIGPDAPVHTISKNRLCTAFPYFRGMFAGNFKENEDQVVCLEEVVGVLSDKSFTLLLRCLFGASATSTRTYTGDEAVTDSIELARLVDMWLIKELDDKLVLRIKREILHDANLRTREHIESACNLPSGNPLRRVFVLAAIQSCMTKDDGLYDLVFQEILAYSTDVLMELQAVVRSISVNTYDVDSYSDLSEYSLCYRDPLSGMYYTLFEYRIN